MLTIAWLSAGALSGRDSPQVAARVGESVLLVEDAQRSALQTIEQLRFDRLYGLGRFQLASYYLVELQVERWIAERLSELSIRACRAEGGVSGRLVCGGEEFRVGDDECAACQRRWRETHSKLVTHVPRRVEVPTDNAPFLGTEDATVTVVEYVDFRCGICRGLEADLLALVHEMGPRMRLVARHFPLSPSFGDTFLLAEAALCAAEEGRYWEFRRNIFRGDWGSIPAQELSARIARELEIDSSSYETCIRERTKRESLVEEQERGAMAGVAGTPALFVNGRRIGGRDLLIRLREIVLQEMSRFPEVLPPARGATATR